jgi:hypothetical protein
MRNNQKMYYELMNGNPAPGCNKNKYLYNGKLKRSVNPALAGELKDDVFAGSSLIWFDLIRMKGSMILRSGGVLLLTR